MGQSTVSMVIFNSYVSLPEGNLVSAVQHLQLGKIIQRWTENKTTKMFETWLMVSTPLKNIRVSWDDDIPNISQYMELYGLKSSKCSKPTRYLINHY